MATSNNPLNVPDERTIPLNPKLYEERWGEQSLLEKVFLQTHLAFVQATLMPMTGSTSTDPDKLAAAAFDVAEAAVRERDRREAIAQAHLDAEMEKASAAGKLKNVEIRFGPARPKGMTDEKWGNYLADYDRRMGR